ncbi:hypothetical protein AB1Y20_004131 [Prymnesium parvum]|uniref:Uncharacterized protein n=1 Tax=Prymnesium parvum TaxID=97485 RepID=A0AB34J795_PRYPA
MAAHLVAFGVNSLQTRVSRATPALSRVHTADPRMNVAHQAEGATLLLADAFNNAKRAITVLGLDEPQSIAIGLLIVGGIAATSSIMAQADRKFDEVDKKFDQIDKKFDQMDKKFDKKFDQVDKKFDQLERTLSPLSLFVAALVGMSILMLVEMIANRAVLT